MSEKHGPGFTFNLDDSMKVLTVIIKFVLVCMVILAFSSLSPADSDTRDPPVLEPGEFSPENPTNTGGLTGTPGSPSVDITGINAVNFPRILSFVTVNTTKGRSGQLRAEDFVVYEDGNLMDIRLIPSPDSTSKAKLDMAIVFDDTGSLEDEIAGLKSKVTELTGSISSADIDCRYSLISFKDTVEIQQEWTSDPTVIRKAVDGLYASGGDDDPEADLDAVEKALEMGFRPDAERIILDITDSATHYRGDGTSFSNYTIPETASHLMSNGISYFLIGPGTASRSTSPSSDKRELVWALGSNGQFFDIHSSDFSFILDRIQKIITGTYTIEYVSPKSSSNGTQSILQIMVGSDADSGQYITSGSDRSGISGSRITPDTAAPGTTVLVAISGTNFPSGLQARLFRNTYSIPLIGTSITPSSISGSFVIPSDAPAGSYSLEVTDPDGKTWYEYNVFTITSSGSSGSEHGIVRSGDISTRGETESSDPGTGDVSIDDECEGWEVNSGYYLVERITDTSPGVDRMPYPWCWCNGYPYNKNYQTCIRMTS